MTGIASTTGLVSGIDYQSLISQLMQLQMKSYTNLSDRTDKLITEESAWTTLATNFLTANYMIENLNKADLYTRCDVSSSNTNVLIATKRSNSSPVEGVYTFTPVQTAMAQQTLASGVASSSDALGKTGTITIGNGWSLENDIYLSDINGGEGFSKGYIRVTDADGNRATIDLRNCVTMNDVLDAINNNTTADVWVELDGDQLMISDLSGGAGEVKIQEVSNGKTAASLGFDTSNSTGTDSITGKSIYRLGESTSLSILNDGNGLVFDELLGDLAITCKDGTVINVDFSKTSTVGEGDDEVTTNKREQSIGDLIHTINNAQGNDGKLVVSISDDGKSLVFTDTTVKKIRGELVDGTDPAEYTLPSTYDAADYELDESGYIMHKTGDKAGQYVGDPDQATKITQLSTSTGATLPILQSLGLLNYNESYIQGVSFTGDSITTRNLIGSMDSPLMSSLNGGRGLANATAGSIEIQDRAGNKTTLDFTADELKIMQSGSLDDAVGMLNSKMESASWTDATGNSIAYGENVGVKIEINDSKTGLNLVDKTGRTTYDMIFRDVVTETDTVNDEGETVTETHDPKIAAGFGLNIGSVSQSKATGDKLNMQTVSHNTPLSDLNGGKGITVSGGQIVITDSAGGATTIRLDTSRHKTVGDLISDINASYQSVQVRAQINATGDGIELIEYAGGTGSFTVADGSGSTVCSELNIAGTVTQEDKEQNGGVMSIDGRTTYSIEVEETDTLEDIRKKINELGGNFSASIISDGSGTPHRLLITGRTTGEVGAMNIDLSALGLTTENITEACDALLVYGDNTNSNGIMLRSSTNTFKNVIEGIDLTVAGTSTSPITVSSELSNTDIKASIKSFVDNYNTFREKYNTNTYYSTVDEAGNILYNSSLAKNFGADVQKALFQTIDDIPGVNSLMSLGVSIRSSVNDDGINTETGKLEFDETVFDALWESNPDAIREFFCRQQTIMDPDGKVDDDGNPVMITQNIGWAQKFVDISDRYVGSDGGKIYAKLETLDKKITNNEERLEYMKGRLEVKEQQLWNKFNNLETSLAKMSTDSSTISSILSSWNSNYSSSGSYY